MVKTLATKLIRIPLSLLVGVPMFLRSLCCLRVLDVVVSVEGRLTLLLATITSEIVSLKGGDGPPKTNYHDDSVH